MLKKALLLLACLALLWPLRPASAEEGLYEPTYGSLYGPSTVKKHLFAGVGLSYNFEMLDINDLTDNVKPVGLDADFSNSAGLRLSIGYRYNGIFVGEFTADVTQGFDWDGSYYYKGKPVRADMTVHSQMFILSGRIQPPLGKLQWFSPYFAVGGGAMFGQVKTDAVVAGHARTYSNSECHPVGRIGTGADFFLTDSISLGLDASYYWGWNELDEVKFFTLTGSTAYHF